MKRIRRYNISIPSFFLIFVCQIIVTIQSETVLQDIRINHNESRSSLKENTTIVQGVAFAEGVCGLNYFCKNGGKCTEDSKKCDCKPGTSGDFCQNVDECEDSYRCGNGSNVQCLYDEKKEKAVCNCKDQNYRFDEEKLRCKKCDCGPNGNCSFVKGKKTCDCKKGYAFNDYDYDYYMNHKPGICKDCKCGEHSDGCEWMSYFTKKCYCHKGYEQDSDGKCSKCVCGEHGKCHFRNWKKICDCHSGFSDKGGTCEECVCGEHGKCRFDNWQKICDCYSGFSDNGGTCEACSCGPDGDCAFQEGNKSCSCHDGYGLDDSFFKPGICKKCNCYLGPNPVNCTFPSSVKHCLCPSGYEQQYDNCVEIDECKEQNPCPKYSVCENIPGSYKCHCKTGFEPIRDERDYEVKDYGCRDINECSVYVPCPFTDTTECMNTIGSYDCVCKFGYVPQSEYSIKSEGCWKDKSSWKIGYVFLIVLFSVITLGLMFCIFIRYRAIMA